MTDTFKKGAFWALVAFIVAFEATQLLQSYSHREVVDMGEPTQEKVAIIANETDIKSPQMAEPEVAGATDSKTESGTQTAQTHAGGASFQELPENPLPLLSVTHSTEYDIDAVLKGLLDVDVTTLKALSESISFLHLHLLRNIDQFDEKLDDIETDIGQVTVADGGVGITSYTAGDMLYASGASALSKLAVGTSGQVLIVSGGLPTWVATSSLGITGGSGATTLAGLTDTNTAGAASGTILMFDGSDWVDRATSSLGITGGGSDTFSTIQSNGSTLNTGVATLDFDNVQFTLTESPADDFDITIASVSGVTGADADDISNDSIELLQDVGAFSQNVGDVLQWDGSVWTAVATTSLGVSGGSGGAFTSSGGYTVLDTITDNVGIGSSSPNNKLTVAGDINISDTTQGYKIGGSRILYSSSTNSSTLVGDGAGASLLSGGLHNTAVGFEAMASTTFGDYNTANGYQALYSNTGSWNTANGYQALFSNTVSNGNTATGYKALYSNTNGVNNTAYGFNALYNNIGSRNTANGYNALYSNTTGSENVANGYYTLHDNTTGSYNTAHGYQALFSNTTGYYNTAHGHQALALNTTGYYNTVSGYQALFSNTVDGVTALGYRAGYENTTGANNIYLGYQAGDNITTGSNNIILGYDIDAPSATGNNQLNIGGVLYGDTGTGIAYFGSNVGIGTTTPDSELVIDGDFLLTGGFYDNNNTRGTNGQILQTDGSGVTWVSTSTLGYTDIDTYTIIQEDGSTLSTGAVTLNFDGTQFGVSESPTDDFDITITDVWGVPGANSDDISNDSIELLQDVAAFTQNIGDILYWNGSAWTITSNFIYDGSNVGIGTTSPTAQLHTTGSLRFENFGSAGASLQTDANGNVSVSSDKRLKNILSNYEGGLSEVLGIEPIQYKWNEMSGLETEHTYTGFSAQNVAEFIPEAVGEDSRGYLTLSDRPLLAAVINAIQELWATLTGHDERIEELEREVELLKEELGVKSEPKRSPAPEPEEESEPEESDAVETETDSDSQEPEEQTTGEEGSEDDEESIEESIEEVTEEEKPTEELADEEEVEIVENGGETEEQVDEEGPEEILIEVVTKESSEETEPDVE
ncbi:tail fiber domain-containing protein [bacterium]|nr:tail fiber domain-containing protein [bacterium]